MTKLTLLILAAFALAAPASAQGLIGASGVGGVLAAGQTVHRQPDLRERRALAMAAFKKQPSRSRQTATSEDLMTAERTQIQPRDEWLHDDGFRILVNRIAYRTRF